ncbi:MAG: diguanylate cyclase [Myxococcales bacterium]|nr:diguanylate cyclase [Myxococcales bacterium]
MTDWDSDTNVTHETEVPSPSTTVRDRASLVVLAGPRVGTLIRLEGREIRIGRSLRAELCLDDDGVSRHHARIRASEGAIWLEDLGSRNGTFVNGVRVSGTVKLEDGDKLHVGRSSILKFTYHDALDDSFQERVVLSALRDPLTQLYNKRYFDERLDAELRFAHRHGTQLALLMIDVDHFKSVNDERGHLVGDTVLTAVATTLARAIRNEDVVARFGGEEFVVILRATALDHALPLAERLRRRVEELRVEVEGGEPMAVTISIGAAALADGIATADELVGAADRALYVAKEAGRNRVAS